MNERADLAHSEGLAATLLLTQMLRILRKQDPGFVRDCFDIPTEPGFPSPVRKGAERRLEEISHEVWRETGPSSG